jgi:hypothetical protein
LALGPGPTSIAVNGPAANIDCPGFPVFGLDTTFPYCDVEIAGPTSVCSNQAIQVTRYHRSFTDDRKGNGSQHLVVPVNKWRCHNRFYAFPGFENRVTVMVPFGAIGGTRLNGAVIPGPWSLFPTCSDGAVAFYWRDLTPAELAAGENAVDGFDASGNPVPVGVVVHGYNGSSQGMYSYPGGLKF